jgi:elongation factor 1-gamma
VHHEDNKKPEFLGKFASGKIPAFEDNEGFTLFEATAIARYGEHYICSIFGSEWQS